VRIRLGTGSTRMGTPRREECTMQRPAVIGLREKHFRFTLRASPSGIRGEVVFPLEY
jgi:hypothetical protein